jgi:putative DNA methylase
MPIDSQFNVAFADQMAALEAYNKHYYRPNTYLHKWWARRCGSTFRTILKHLVADESKLDYYTAGGLEGAVILDPMMGGGTTLHEAIRLGANVIGADIDPIPVLQARATLSALPLEILQAQFERFFARLVADLSPLYQTNCPHCHSASELQFMLYGLQKQCACGDAIFVDSLVLRHHNNEAVTHLCPETQDIFYNSELVAKADPAFAKTSILEKSVQACERCGRPYQEPLHLPYYQRYVPLAAWGECVFHRLFITSPGQKEHDALAEADAQRATLPFAPADFQIGKGPKSKSLLARGITSYLDLFSSRQLLFLGRAIEHLQEVEPLTRLNLALLVSTSLEFNSMLCGYKGMTQTRPGAIRHTFSHHAYSFPHTALENNPVYSLRASGNLRNLFHNRIVRGRTWAMNPVERRINQEQVQKVVIQGEVDAGQEVTEFAELQAGSRRFLLLQGSSVSLNVPSDSVDYVVTDPPYFDSVQYSDLAAFFRVWLRQLLPGAVDWEYSLDEAAVDQQSNGSAQYERVLGGIFAECHRVLKKEHGRLIFTFHHWKPEGWAALTKALKQAGFILVNRYVVHAENPLSVHIANQNVLLHDVILVLAAKESNLQPTWQIPAKINADDGKTFCYECGTAVGWLLAQNVSDSEIESWWKKLEMRNEK